MYECMSCYRKPGSGKLNFAKNQVEEAPKAKTKDQNFTMRKTLFKESIFS